MAPPKTYADFSFDWVCEQMKDRFQRFEEEICASGSLYDIEQGLRRLRGLFASLALKVVSKRLEKRDAELERCLCPCCGQPMNENRLQEMTLQFAEGDMKLLRRYCECRDCKVYCFPLDGSIARPAEGEITPQFGHDLALLHAELPNNAAIRVLQTLTQRKLSKTAFQQHVRRDGDALIELERQEAEALWPYDEKLRLRAVDVGFLPDLRFAPPPSRVIYVEMDGVMANLGADMGVLKEIRDFEAEVRALVAQGIDVTKGPPSTWREVRQMRIFRRADVVESKTRSGHLRRTISRSETVSVVFDPSLFEKRVNAVAEGWRVREYEVRVVIADGAKHLWDLAATVISPTVEILDFPHAKSHVYDCAKALFGNDSREAHKWANTWSKSLKRNGPAKLRDELARLGSADWGENGNRVLANLVEYVDTHYHRMDYPAFLKEGYPIASGAIESANRQVVGDRCKRSGMRWSKVGLQQTVSLRAALISGNWEKVCRAIREYRSYWAAFHRKLAARLSVEEAPTRADGPETATRIDRSKETRSSGDAAPSKPRKRPLIPERKMSRLIFEGVIEATQDGDHRLAATG